MPQSVSRRPSQMTGTPLLPGVTGSGFSQGDEGDVPLRHPRPLTQAELHLEMEQEQEAAVNRLARELSALRAQHSASTASNASSSAASNTEPPIRSQSQTLATTDMTHPSPVRHRSSSSLSTRSNHLPAQPSQQSRASIERARDAMGQGTSPNLIRSRQNSLGITGSGGLGGGGLIGGGVNMPAPSRSRTPSTGTRARTSMSGASPGWQGGSGDMYFSLPQRTPSQRLEEAERARSQLESVRRENDMLVARVRELEGLLREKKSGGVTGDAEGGAAA